jgi:hypothetical protein
VRSPHRLPPFPTSTVRAAFAAVLSAFRRRTRPWPRPPCRSRVLRPPIPFFGQFAAPAPMSIPFMVSSFVFVGPRSLPLPGRSPALLP